jgi:hypothetical protein
VRVGAVISVYLESEIVRQISEGAARSVPGSAVERWSVSSLRWPKPRCGRPSSRAAFSIVVRPGSQSFAIELIATSTTAPIHQRQPA